MNTGLWSIQALLAAVFGSSGTLKAIRSKDRLVASGQTGVSHFRVSFIRFIAISELLGALGLIVPWWTQIAAILTPIAAVGLAAIMVGAASAHARLMREHRSDCVRRRKELRNIGTNAVLFALCLLVVVGRGLAAVE
jgi:DoxX-like family